MRRFSSVLITGASSGIGRALALCCAAPGVRLHLGGRDADRLAQVAAEARAQGAEVAERIADVRDAAAMQHWIATSGRLDLVIANAGISAGTGNGAPEQAAQTRAIFATNLDGVLNTVLPALTAMTGQAPGADGWRGRIAAIASIAAFVPAPGAPAYCASKAAVDSWIVASGKLARERGVALISVCPGYIRTPMTATNRFPMPGLMDADRAARTILRGIAAGRRRIAFPWYLHATARLVSLLPPRLLTEALGASAGKEPMPPG
jgi:short-subunit dehydrogenase